MWSSTTRSLAALALLGACTGNPDVVIDVTTAQGAAVTVFSCMSETAVNIADCHDHMLSPNEHSVGIYTDQKVLSVAWQVMGDETYCQQVELDLAHGTIDLDYLAATTAAAAMLTCDPTSACGQVAVCK